MLEVQFLKKLFKNPFVLASGILGVTGASMANGIRHGAAGVTMKSVCMEEVSGNPNPVMIAEENYMLNAVGLPGPGVTNALIELKEFRRLAKTDAILLGSIFGTSVREFGEVTKKICAGADIDFLEVDCSCPHASHLYKKPFAYDARLAANITRVVKRATRVPFSMKLSPNAWNIADIAKACEDAGADAITAVNTVSGMRINVDAHAPVLANKVGGMSGPALKPIALKAVWDIYRTVKIPIIGTGGVTTGEDALEMVMAGARLIGVGSAFYFRGSNACTLIAKEMQTIMKRHHWNRIEDIIGMAHEL